MICKGLDLYTDTVSQKRVAVSQTKNHLQDDIMSQPSGAVSLREANRIISNVRLGDLFKTARGRVNRIVPNICLVNKFLDV